MVVVVVVTAGVVVVVAAIVVVERFRPCFGRVVTVVPSAMMNVVVNVGNSPMVETPLITAVHSPGVRNNRPASSAINAPPGRVMGTLMV